MTTISIGKKVFGVKMLWRPCLHSWTHQICWLVGKIWASFLPVSIRFANHQSIWFLSLFLCFFFCLHLIREYYICPLAYIPLERWYVTRFDAGYARTGINRTTHSTYAEWTWFGLWDSFTIPLYDGTVLYNIALYFFTLWLYLIVHEHGLA